MSFKHTLSLAAILGAATVLGTNSCDRKSQSVQVSLERRFDEFMEHEVRMLKEHKVSIEAIKPYHSRFGVYHGIQLLQLGVSFDQANKYKANLGSSTVVDLCKAGITPEVANLYDPRLEQSIVSLHNLRANPEIANKYNKRFNSGECVALSKANVTPELADQYNQNFAAPAIANLHRLGVNPEAANNYYKLLQHIWKHHIPEHVEHFHKAGVPSDKAVLYDRSFVKNGYEDNECSEIIALHKAGIEPEYANKFAELNKAWGSRISGHDIIFFTQKGIRYEEIEQRTKDLILKKRITED